MMGEIFSTISYFLALSVKTELLWIILPLAIATLVMLFYQEKYKNECPGWNSYVSNSLVLLFVSVILFRTIYGINGEGAINFISYPGKTAVSAFVLFIGIILLFLNFEHYLPEKVARHVSSPLTVNLVAYIMILFVYLEVPLDSIAGNGIVYSSPPTESGWVIFISLLLLFVLLLVILNLIRIPIERLFRRLQEMKEKERVENLREEQKKIETQKKEIKKYERKLKKVTLQEVNKRKKEAKKLKKIIKK